MIRLLTITLLLLIASCSSSASESKLYPGEPKAWEGREKGIWFCLYIPASDEYSAQSECQPKLELCRDFKKLHEELGHKPKSCERIESKVFCMQVIDDKDKARFFCTPNKVGCERYRIDYGNAGFEVTECQLMARLPPSWDSATFSAATRASNGNSTQQMANPTPLESHGSAVMSGTSP